MTVVADFIIDYLPSGSLSVSFPYDPLAVDLIRAIPGRRWNKSNKFWSIPRTSLKLLTEQAGRRGVGVQLSDKVRTALNMGKERNKKLEAAKEDSTPFDLPTDTDPYGFQYAGIRYAKYALHNFKGALIGDDQGLGKTFEALSIVAMHEKLSSVLVLCPATLKFTWADQIEEHYPQLSFVVIDGDKKKREELWSAESRIKIANYELLLRDAEPRIHTWDLIIADEVGSMLKNYKAQRTKRTKKLKRRYTLALSGIPLENRLEDLHSVFDFVIPGLLGPGWLFYKQHVITNYWGQPIGYRGLEEIKARIAPYYIRRTKKEVLAELPDKIYNQVNIKLSSDEWALYGAVLDQIKAQVKDNPKLTVGNILTMILRLKQVINDCRLVDESGIDSTKTATIRDIVNAAEGHQIVIFTQFAKYAEILAEEFEAPIIQGSVKPERRNEIIREFQDGQHKVLVSTDAGAYGITLHAADIVIHADSVYNPAKMRQREDRLHRIGQTEAVQVITLHATNTVEDDIKSIIYTKLKLIATVLDEDIPEAETPNITKGMLLEVLNES